MTTAEKPEAKKAKMKTQNVIWIASYPKSGNRWMTGILKRAGVPYGLPPGGIIGIYQLKASGKPPEACPAVAEEFTQDGPCAVLKTHAVHVAGQKLLHRMPGYGLATAGFIHIYRNPLDVLLSYINFSRIEYERMVKNEQYKDGLFKTLLGFDRHFSFEEWGKMGLDEIPQVNLDHALQKFSESGMQIPTLVGMSGSWSDYVQSWLDAAETIPNVTLRYEDCIEDPEHLVALAKFFRFSEDDVRTAVEQVNGKARKGSESEDQYKKVIYNKMKSYYFVNYFSKAAVQKFLADNEEMLRRFGYGDLASRM